MDLFNFTISPRHYRQILLFPQNSEMSFYKEQYTCVFFLIFIKHALETIKCLVVVDLHTCCNSKIVAVLSLRT